MRKHLLLILAGAVLLSPLSQPRAQGVIYGSVEDPIGNPPPSGSVVWLGFLDGTDEEIRIESNVGSGYDGSFWFDDFQNYTTEAAGNRYDYVFHYPDGGVAVHINGLIPNNSFENRNVALTEAASDPAPAIVEAVVDAQGHVLLTWLAQPGLSHRVYRRDNGNNGVFRRVDNPAGDTADRGVTDTVYADATTSLGTEYVYILVGVDSQGKQTPHSSEVVAVPSSSCLCPNQTDLDGNGVPDAVDLQIIIDIVFFGSPTIKDPMCPNNRPDLDCNGFDDVTDLALMIDYVFFGGPPPCDPCL
ncbi:MAG: hypothetical protein AB1752_07700 [Candidatus Zixiibacteriota bacterium]